MYTHTQKHAEILTHTCHICTHARAQHNPAIYSSQTRPFSFLHKPALPIRREACYLDGCMRTVSETCACVCPQPSCVLGSLYSHVALAVIPDCGRAQMLCSPLQRTRIAYWVERINCVVSLREMEKAMEHSGQLRLDVVQDASS